MKLEAIDKDLIVEEVGSSFKNKKAKISEKNLPYIFSILSRFYSRPHESVIREITSNCFDAHIKAKKYDEPVFLKLYMDETSQLFIDFMDNGTGMTEEIMDNIYMEYGESDKRESDEFIGAFGLGSKSPFSVSQYFYVITRVDGTEFTYLLNTTPKGPEYDCIGTKPTDKVNGTTIRVPIKPNELGKWKEAINTQLRYFTNVFFVNFEGITNEYKIREFRTFQIREDYFASNATRNLHLVLGKVTYPIRFEELGLETISFNAALRFQIGELEVIENREELRLSDRTVKAIKAKIEDFKKEITEIVSADINTVYSDIKGYLRASNLLNDKQIIVRNLLPEKNINLSLLNLKCRELIDLKISLQLNGETIRLHEPKLLSKNEYFNLLYKRNYGRLTTVISKQDRRDFKALESGYIYSEKSIRLKLNERNYVCDQNPRYFVTFNQKEFRIDITDTILKAKYKAVNGKFKIKEVKDALRIYNIFFEAYKMQLLTNKQMERHNFKDYDIPVNYGIVKKPRVVVKKAPDTILMHEFSLGNKYKKEVKDEHFTKHMVDRTFVYGTKDQEIELLKFSRIFGDPKLKLEISTIILSPKYIKMVKHHPNCISFDDLETNGFYKAEKFIKLFKDFSFQKQFIHSFGNFKSPNDEYQIKELLEFISDDNRFIFFKNALIKYTNFYNSSFLNENLSESYYIDDFYDLFKGKMKLNLRERISKATQVQIKKIVAERNRMNDFVKVINFELKLTQMIDELGTTPSADNTELLNMLLVSLNKKKSKIKQILKIN